MQLVRLAQQGDADAFVSLMKKHEIAMYKVAKSYLGSEADVADAMQETTMYCFERIGQLQKPEYFKTWLIRILINKCKDMRRYAKTVVLELPEERAAADPNQANVEFQMMMDSFPEPDRTILLLYYDQRMRVREISQCMEMSVDAVKSRLKRGRARFKASL